MPKEAIQEILELRLPEVFPRITIALCIFASFPALLASGGRNFNVLK
jgi:hypothetical protein